EKSVQSGVVQVHRIPRQGREQPPLLGKRLEPEKSEAVDCSGPEEIFEESPEIFPVSSPGHPMLVTVRLDQIQQISLETPFRIGFDPLSQHGGRSAALKDLEGG